MQAKEWRVAIHLTEVDDDRTSAVAVLTTDDRTVQGQGIARRRPGDRPVPEIGDELAAARALGDLATQLMELAAADIEAVS